jgi:hypothetical protein
MTRAPLAAALAAALHLAAPARADAPAVALAGPEIVKLDWNIRALAAADLDGDGLADLAVIDHDRASIEFLYQLKPGAAPTAPKPGARANRWEPVLDDARFRRAAVTIGFAAFDLAVGDLNGDGRPDLAFTAEPQPLTIRHQQADGSWREQKFPEAPAPARSLGTLKITDLDGDGRPDLAMLGQKEIALYRQQPDRTLAPPERLALADENCFGLELCDVNADGRPDLLYLANSARDTLRVRLQTAAQQFGPELAFPLKSTRCTLQILPPATTGGPPVFAVATSPAGQLEFFALDPAASGDAGGGAAPRPRVFAPPGGARTGATAYAFGDYDGDGREDLAMSDPGGAQVFVYFRQPDGGFTTPKKFPSFAEARALAATDWDGDGRADLLVASPKEQALGLASVNTDGRLGYPQPLPVPGRPLAVAAGDLGDKRASIVALAEDKGARSVVILQRQRDGSAKVARTLPLDGLKTDPRAVRLVDANQDGRLDLAIFVPLDAMRLLVQQPDGGFTDASAGAGFRKGLVDDLDAAAFATGDIDGDGKPELLVSSGAMTRALRLDAKGALAVVDQFNARDSAAEIANAFVVPAAAAKSGERGRPDVLLYDSKGEQFQRLHAGADGVYEVAVVSPAGKLEVVAAEARAPRGGGAPELFLLGNGRFWWLPAGRDQLALRALSTHTTDLPETGYADVTAGDLTGDGVPELVTVDLRKNVVEILARDPATGAWASRLHFKVFEADEHFSGRKGSALEPRETVIADVTGDGKKDLILLVHDRVLVYPQQ